MIEMKRDRQNWSPAGIRFIRIIMRLKCYNTNKHRIDTLNCLLDLEMGVYCRKMVAVFIFHQKLSQKLAQTFVLDIQINE